jgi:hypothetical protein
MHCAHDKNKTDQVFVVFEHRVSFGLTKKIKNKNEKWIVLNTRATSVHVPFATAMMIPNFFLSYIIKVVN